MSGQQTTNIGVELSVAKILQNPVHCSTMENMVYSQSSAGIVYVTTLTVGIVNSRPCLPMPHDLDCLAVIS